MRRSTLIWIPVGGALIFALVGLVIMFGLANGPIKRVIESSLSDRFGQPVTIASLEGNPFFNFSLSRVVIGDSDEPVFACGEVAVQYRHISLFWGDVVVDSLKFVSPRLRWVRATGREDLRFDRDDLPSIDLQSITVEHGIVSVVNDGRIRQADDLNLELALNNRAGESTLQVRKLRTLVLDPPIEIQNLSGLALSRDDVLLLEEVRLSTPRSSLVLSGEFTGPSDPRYVFDVTVDSLNLTEFATVTGVDLPRTSVWFAGKVEGTDLGTSLAFDWVVGGAAGDIFVKVDAETESHTILLHGREVDLSALTGVPLRGDLALTASGKGRKVSEATGTARATVSRGGLYGVAVDSAWTDLVYREGTLSGTLDVVGEIGEFAGRLVANTDLDLSIDGRVTGVDLQFAGGPETEIGGRLDVNARGGETEVRLNLNDVWVGDYDAGNLSASLTRRTADFTLDTFEWQGNESAFSVTGSGDVWRESDDLFDLVFSGKAAPGHVLPDFSKYRDVSFRTRVWSEGLAFGATQERIFVSAGLGGVFGLDSLSASATADGDRIAVDVFEAAGEASSLNVTGDVILNSAYDLQATYLTDVISGIPEAFSLGATGSAIEVNASAVGPWDAPDVLVTLVADELEVAGGSFDDVSLEASVPVDGKGGVSLDAAVASWGGRSLPGFAIDVGTVGGEVSFLIGNKEGSENWVAVWGGATVGADLMSVRVDSARIQLQDEYLANQGPIAFTHSAEAGLVIQQLYLVGPSGELEAAPHSDNRAINIRISEFGLAPWAFLVGMDDRLEGTLSGGIAIAGSVTQVSTVADFEVANARIDSFQADALYGEFSYQDDQVFGKIGARIGTGDLYVEGTAGTDPLDPSREVDVRLVSEAVPLTALNGMWPQITNIDGELSGQVWMTGSADDVQMNGDLVASSGAFTIPSLNRGLEKVILEVDVSPDSLTFSEFSGKGLTGELSATGTIDLLPLNLDRVVQDPIFGDLDLDIIAAQLDASGTEDIRATIDGSVRLTGTLESPALTGTLSLPKAEIRLLSMLEAPPDPESIWRVIPFFENMQCELQLSTERQLWVRDETVNVELSGDLDVLRSADDIAEKRTEETGFRFFGTMNSLRGTYRFQNRTFRIQRDGELRFLGERAVDPEAAILAWARFPIMEGDESAPQRREQHITVSVAGSFAHPEVVLLNGTPDLHEGQVIRMEDHQESQPELLSYILFGRSPELLIAAEQSMLGEQSTGLVLGLATRELQSRLADRLNLDMVQVDMASASEIDRVTIGKYIGDKLFVTYEDQIGQGREFAVEYVLLPRFSLASSFKESPDGQVLPKLQLTWGKDW